MSADKDLQHFLKLASMQVRHRLKTAAANEPYSERINKLKMLEELIKEQIPDESSRPPARASR